MVPAGFRRAFRACALALDSAWARVKDETAKPRRGVRERVRTVESEVVLKALTAARFIWTTAGGGGGLGPAWQKIEELAYGYEEKAEVFDLLISKKQLK